MCAEISQIKRVEQRVLNDLERVAPPPKARPATHRKTENERQLAEGSVGGGENLVIYTYIIQYSLGQSQHDEGTAFFRSMQDLFLVAQSRLERVPGFLSPRPNWVRTPLTRRRVCSPHLWFQGVGGRIHCLRERGWVDPIRTRGQTLWYSTVNGEVNFTCLQRNFSSLQRILPVCSAWCRWTCVWTATVRSTSTPPSSLWSAPHSISWQEWIQHAIHQIAKKTPTPKCRLYLCLIWFIDWRYSQSCWYFRLLL